MALMVRRRNCRYIMVFLSLVFAGHAQEPPLLDNILRSLELNLIRYQNTLPSLFCDEHVVSEVRRQQAAKPFEHTVNDSLFRLQRGASEGTQGRFVESRDVRSVNGTPVKGDSQRVQGPDILSGAFSGALSFVSSDQKGCVSYHLRARNSEQNDYKVDFESLPKNERLATCVVSEEVKGSAWIDLTNMQIDRLEFATPEYRITTRASRHQGASKEFEGTWIVSVDYAPVMLGNQLFWMPKTIVSTKTSAGTNPVIWSYTAQYSNYHKFEVTSHVLPFSGTVSSQP